MTESGRLWRLLAISVLVARLNAGSSFAADPTQVSGPQEQSTERFVGNYQLPNGKILGIELFRGDDGKLVLLYSDYRSGIVRRLFPIADDRFGIGPGFSIATPVELAIRFIKDEKGAVISAVLERPGKREVIARRVPLKSQDITFTSGDATLSGTLLTPPTTGPHPAIVLLHGSGRLTRYSFGPYPHFFTSLGLAVLVYDKRASGASTGRYLPRTAYYPQDFLKDAMEAVHFLQARADIDAKRIGLWGSSEGGMLTTQVAAQMKNIAFVVNSSGFMTPLWEQVLYNIEAQLRADGFSYAEVSDAVNYEKLALQVMRTGEGWDPFAEAQANARQKKWWTAYFGSSTGFSSLEAIRWQWDHVYSFDPLPALKSVDCPVLGVFGALDTSTPVRSSAANMRRLLGKSGNKNLTIKIFAKANHPLIEARTGSNAEIPSLKRQVPGLFDTLRWWVLKQIKSRNSSRRA